MIHAGLSCQASREVLIAMCNASHLQTVPHLQAVLFHAYGAQANTAAPKPGHCLVCFLPAAPAKICDAALPPLHTSACSFTGSFVHSCVRRWHPGPGPLNLALGDQWRICWACCTYFSQSAGPQSPKSLLPQPPVDTVQVYPNAPLHVNYLFQQTHHAPPPPFHLCGGRHRLSC